MSASVPAPLRLTGSLLAQSFRFRCDRQLRWELVPRAHRGGDVPAPNADPSRGPRVGARAGMGLLTQAGMRWERRVMAQLVARYGSRVRLSGHDEHGDAARLPYDAFIALLRNPGDAAWVVQPELRVEAASFAARFGLPAGLELAPAHPDLVRIRHDANGRMVLGVADVKWSREGTIQHYAQVAYYAILLEEICRAEGIDARVEARWGWLWTRGSRGPRRFPLPAYRHHVEEFLREELPRVAACAPREADWHLRPRCASCAFFDHCRHEADRTDDLARVVGLTPLARASLREKGIHTVRQLRTAEFRNGVYSGCHALESAEGTLKKRVQALDFRKLVPLGRPSFRMGTGERVRLLLSAEGDPVSGTVFALGFRIERGGARGRSRVFLSPRGSEEGEREMLAAFLTHAATAVTEAVASLPEEEGRRREGAVHFYLWDRAEAELLRDCLQRHLGDPGSQPGIAGVARLLFPGGDGASPPPGTVVLEVVSELFALPIAYAWDLASVSEALVPVENPARHRANGGYAWPFSSQVAFERIHNVWGDRPFSAGGETASPGEVRDEIIRTVESKLAALDSVVRGIRDHAARWRNPALRLEAAGTAADGGGPIDDPTLEQLRLFTLAEAAEETVAIRQLHALPTADRARRFECISGMHLVARLENGHAVFEFDEACREVKFRPGDFALVLTNDDGRTLAETDTKPWLRRKLMVELVEFDLAASPPRVTLAPDTKWETLEKTGAIDLDRVCVLDRAGVDFNTKRVIASLRALGQGAGESAFVLDALHGRVDERQVAPLDEDAGWMDAVQAAHDLRGYGLNAEQETAWRAVFHRPVSVVWGPPGTGKTYLLAWILLGMAAAARRMGRPLRMLVSASTHRAIANVLVRVARELESAGIEPPLRALKLAGRGSEADADLEGLPVDVIRDERLDAVLKEADSDGLPVLVGSTVWSLWKQMRALNGAGDEEEASGLPLRPLFDVVVIDEASQMKVPDALIALSSIRPGGRVVFCGDDRQLPPILHGRYPREETLFGSAFTHLARHFAPLPLRESRRMNRALVRWPRRLFYPGFVSVDAERRLVLAPDAADLADPVDALLLSAFLAPDDAAVLCTYDGFRATARNALEAEIAARLARLARAALLDPATGRAYTAEAFRTHALAILSPHRAQNAAILGELVAGGWPREELPVVDTVERMQGNERELVIVSYAVADGEYAEREAEFLLNPNRFNVAITRPRAKLIVLASEAVLRTVPRDERVMEESIAIKGYPSQFATARTVEYPAPGGGSVTLTVRALPLDSGLRR